jgi:endogenous inhibitor of DNA gyrase (YacG/DUF329 family)
MVKASTPAPNSCAICGKPVERRFKPFCSARCADVDLNRWLSGRYVIAGTQTPDDEEDRPGVPPKDQD